MARTVKATGTMSGTELGEVIAQAYAQAAKDIDLTKERIEDIDVSISLIHTMAEFQPTGLQATVEVTAVKYEGS